MKALSTALYWEYNRVNPDMSLGCVMRRLTGHIEPRIKITDKATPIEVEHGP